MNKIILFGGAFDPIHLGHLKMAKRSLDFLNADRLIFIPTNHSPFKGEEIRSDYRLEMVKAGVRNSDSRIEVSDYEAKSDKVSYTFDTVTYFKTLYPSKDYDLYFLIGSDQEENLDKWYRIKELSGLVRFICFSRPSYPLNTANMSAFRVGIIPDLEMDISSTDIRMGRKLDCPEGVIDYIVSEELYFMPFIRENEKPRRFEHSKQVGKLAYKIAEANSLRPEKAYLAGLLHDITRMRSTPADIRKADEEYSSFFPGGKIPSWCYHQFTARMFLEREMGFEDAEILDAITYHTTGKKNMSPLGMILYAADKIEPTRGYDSSNLIRAMMDDYKEGFRIVLKANRDFLYRLDKSKMVLDEFSRGCFNYYLKG